MLIGSRGTFNKVLLTPKVTKVIYVENLDFTVFYTLNISFESGSYNLPFKVLFEKQPVAVIDEDTFSILETKSCFIKKRDVDFNFHRYIREHKSQQDLHIIIKCIALLFTFKNVYQTEIVENNSQPRVDDNSFFFVKDDLLKDNRLIQYQVDERILDANPTELDYAPKNCSLIRIYKPIFEGTVDQCEELLFNNINLKAFRKRQFEKLSKVNDASSPFNRREAERDTFYAMTNGQLGDFEEFRGDIDDVDIWSGN